MRTVGVGYQAIRAVIRLLLWVFYRRIDAVGLERIPQAGPVILAANHHNSLVDSLILITRVPRSIVVLANAPLFRHPLVGPFLRVMGAVPVHRRLEAGDDPHKNDAMFAAVIETLRGGRVILVFPEGRTLPQPVLLPLRTGAARMLLGAEARSDGPARVTLLPVGMIYHDPGTFRSASVELMVGEPVPTADLVARHREQPEETVRALTTRLTDAIRARIVEAEDHYTLTLLAVLEQAWREEARLQHGASTSRIGIEEALSWKQEVMRGARYLEARAPERVSAVRRRVEAYRAHLEEVGLTGEQLGQPYTTALVLRYVFENLLWLAVGLPMAVWGFAVHGAPYWLTGRAVRWLDRTLEEEATDKMAAGLVFYPALWVAEGWLLARFLGAPALLGFALLLFPSGFLALAWRERLGRVGRQARAFVRFLLDRDLHPRLLDERRALIAELRTLAEALPQPARSVDGRDVSPGQA